MKISYFFIAFLSMNAILDTVQLANQKEAIDTLQQRVESIQADLKLKAQMERIIRSGEAPAQPAASLNLEQRLVDMFTFVATAPESELPYVTAANTEPFTMGTNSYRIVEGILIPVE